MEAAARRLVVPIFLRVWYVIQLWSCLSIFSHEGGVSWSRDDAAGLERSGGLSQGAMFTLIRNQAVGLVSSASTIARPREWRWLVAAIGLASLGILLILFHTRNGPGVTGDSVHYVMGAENLLAGRGYARTAGGGEAVPITGFPPGYSGVLSGVGLFVEDLFDGGRMPITLKMTASRIRRFNFSRRSNIIAIAAAPTRANPT